MGKQETMEIDADGGYTIIEGPTAMLRWRGTVLEQRFKVTHFNYGREVGCDFEWRPVPALNEDSGE